MVRSLKDDIIAESAQDLPAVQVGDPFQEKKLLEACLEVIQTGAIVGMQDMGAAGISAEVNEAPPIPSLPVALPTNITGLPFPFAVAETVSPAFTIPTLIAFTSGLVW